MNKTMLRCAAIYGLFLLASAPSAFANDATTFHLVIKDHKFEPAELHVPAGTPFVVKVQNMDSTAEEIESAELKIEKVFAGRSEGILRVRPMPAGRHEFMGEYHSDTAKGAFVAK